MAPCEEEEIALEAARRGSVEDPRRGSLGIVTNRRGSRLSDIIQMQERKRKNRGRYRDKQGFTWRPFIAADEELPVPRVPHPHIEMTPVASTPTTSHPQPYQVASQPGNKNQNEQSQPSHAPPVKPPNGDIIRCPPRAPNRKSNSHPSSPAVSPSPKVGAQNPSGRVLPGGAEDLETMSIKSNRSDNSFKTASSDVQINFVPRQISESYKHVPPESAALERKSSVRALQHQQYSVLNTGNNGSSLHQNQPPSVPNRTESKIVR